MPERKRVRVRRTPRPTITPAQMEAVDAVFPGVVANMSEMGYRLRGVRTAWAGRGIITIRAVFRREGDDIARQISYWARVRPLAA